MGYGVTFVDFFLSITYLIILKQFFIDKRKFLVIDQKIGLSIILIIFAVIFSGIGLLFWGGRESYLQFIKTLSHFSFVALYGLVALAIEINYKTIFNILKIYLYSSILINLYAIYQLFARIYGLPFAYIDITNVSFQTRDFDREVGEYTQVVLNFENFYRATSIFSEPSALAWFNVYCLIIILIPLLSHNMLFIQRKWILYLSLGLTTISLFLTFSLTGLLMIIVLIITIVIIEKIRLIRLFSISIAIVALLYITDIFQMNFTQISVANLFYDRISGLFSDQTRGKQMTTGESAPDRIESVQNAINMFLDYPITGIGSGNTYNYPKSTKRFTHSSFFHLLGETGIIGAACFVLLFIYVFKAIMYLNKHRYRFLEKSPELATLQSFAIYLTVILFFSSFFIASSVGNYGFWLELGLILIVYRQTVKEVELSDSNEKTLDTNYSVE